MSAQDEQHLYSLPYEQVPMASHDYNDLENKPQINGVTLKGNKSLSDLGIPTKTSELTNDEGFITSSEVPTKTSDLINDSDFTTKEYVDGEIDAIETILNDLDGIITLKHFCAEKTFTSTFDNLASNLTTQLTAIKTALNNREFAEIKALCINTIGNLKPTHTIIINSETDILNLIIDWQGFSYNNNVVQAIDIVNKKILQLTMTNDTPANDAFVSYFEDTNTYTFVIEYNVYKEISLA